MIGPSVLVPTLIFFWDRSFLTVSSATYPLQHEIMRALQLTREEMAAAVAKYRIYQYLFVKLPPSARFRIKPRESVRVLTETSR